MKALNFLKILVIFFIPILLFSQDISEKKLNEEEVNNSIVEEKLLKQIKIAKKTINNINNELYTKRYIENLDFDKKISFLLSRININIREHNDLAVKRDEIKVLKLKEERYFTHTLKEIIDAKKSFKDKEYFFTLLKSNIKLLKNSSYKEFKAEYNQEKNNKNKISEELVQNYLDLINQNNEQLFTLRYMRENMNEYRTSNFFIDEFNLQYLIQEIDSTPFLSNISQITSYYLKFSIGELLLVLSIILFFRLMNKTVILVLISFINKLFIRSYLKGKKEEDQELDADLKTYIKKSIGRPLIFTLYLLSIHISLYILIKDSKLINEITPWINTTYMAIFTWAVYALLSNSISNFAQHLVEKYPNVRREMIVFILRIIKIVLILLVLLFLFTQLGIDIKAIAASLGVGGIAIALASKDTLTNFFGSLSIMTDNSFSQGDWIIANGVEGTVVDIRMRTTRIRTFDNAMITVPNSELANANIKNYSKRKIGRRIKMKIGITYESKMDDIVNLKNDILNMLENHPDIATEKNSAYGKSKKFEAIKREDLQGVKRTLLVYIDEYDASSINILIYCFSRSPIWKDWLSVKENVLIQINELVEKNNCEFAYPTQTLLVKK